MNKSGHRCRVSSCFDRRDKIFAFNFLLTILQLFHCHSIFHISYCILFSKQGDCSGDLQTLTQLDCPVPGMAYSLVHSYAGQALINGFNWVDHYDYSHGAVQYQNQSSAAALGLWSVDPLTGSVRLGVDHTNIYDPSSGRPSIRLESKEAFNHGLFIADFSHMPPAQCGVWPAFWAYGPDWPNSGEVDMIEGVNTSPRNLISAHTNDGCMLGNAAQMASGAVQSIDCSESAGSVGCGYAPPPSDETSYGESFNTAGGGIYAMQWDGDYIKVWHFDRRSIPRDIIAGKPEPGRWGRPEAVFGGPSCDVDSNFRDLSLVINIDFCGDWGNAVWEPDGCSALGPSCAAYVAHNPAAFNNTYWEVNYINAYAWIPSTTTSVNLPTHIHSGTTVRPSASRSPSVNLGTSHSAQSSTSMKTSSRVHPSSQSSSDSSTTSHHGKPAATNTSPSTHRSGSRSASVSLSTFHRAEPSAHTNPSSHVHPSVSRSASVNLSTPVRIEPSASVNSSAHARPFVSGEPSLPAPHGVLLHTYSSSTLFSVASHGIPSSISRLASATSSSRAGRPLVAIDEAIPTSVMASTSPAGSSDSVRGRPLEDCDGSLANDAHSQVTPSTEVADGTVTVMATLTYKMGCADRPSQVVAETLVKPVVVQTSCACVVDVLVPVLVLSADS